MAEVKEKVTLKQALDTLQKAVTDTAMFFDDLNPADLPTLLKAFKHLDESKDTLEGLNKIIGAIYKKCSEETIPNQFESMGMDSCKLAGRNFIVSGKMRANIPSDKTEKGLAWLRANGFSELIKEGVNANTLSSAIKSHFEEKAVLPPEDCITVYTHKYTSMRKT